MPKLMKPTLRPQRRKNAQCKHHGCKREAAKGQRLCNKHLLAAENGTLRPKPE